MSIKARYNCTQLYTRTREQTTEKREALIGYDIINNMSKEEIKKMENMMAASGMPRGINISIRFDKELQNITQTEGFPMMISEGASFLFLLQSVFIEYPKIEKKYPPGALGFSINGIPPRNHAVLLDGDTVDFFIPQ